VFFFFLITNFFNRGGGGGEIGYVSFLGEVQEVLDAHELQKNIPGHNSLTFLWSFAHSHCRPHSGVIASHLTHSFT
jgi:hypothetical protein